MATNKIPSIINLGVILSVIFIRFIFNNILFISLIFITDFTFYTNFKLSFKRLRQYKNFFLKLWQQIKISLVFFGKVSRNVWREARK